MSKVREAVAKAISGAPRCVAYRGPMPVAASQEDKTMERHPAYWTHEADESAGHLYSFAPTNAAPPPYRHQRHVEAIIDIADDGTLAGVELIDDMPPPPTAALTPPEDVAGLVKAITDDLDTCHVAGVDFADWPAFQLLHDAATALTRISARLAEVERERDEAQASLRDWREGDKEGVVAHMHAFKARAEAAEAREAELRDALVTEREENLINAYNTGIERDGRWMHSFMSDGEWLAAQCGFDPRQADYDAAEIKAAIPKAARAILAEIGAANG